MKGFFNSHLGSDERHPRRYFAKRVFGKTTLIAILLTLALSLVSGQAFAWTQEINEFDSGGTVVCGSSQYEPCVAWAQGYHQSITVKVYIDPSMYTQGFDFRPEINAAISNFNSAPAWNPYYSACYTSGCGAVSYTYAPTLACSGGVTDVSGYGTPFQATVNGQTSWYAALNSVPIIIEHDNFVKWNTNMQFNFNCSAGTATYDAYVVIAHEMGHSEGLGHTNHSPALMMSGETCCRTLQNDDKNGLHAIYPGYWPG
ncbi:MAG: matrixin family metalloprotease [Ktedonobacteraceae bacterium]